MIRSNIGQVMRRLERLEAGVPAVIERSVAVKRWQLPLKNAARLAMQAVALPGEEKWVDSFAEAVHGAVTMRGVTWTLDGGKVMEAPPQVESVRDLMAAGFGRKGYRLPAEQASQGAFALETVRTAVFEWVAEEKRRDPIDDAGLTDAELADRIQFIMGLHPRSRGEKRTAAMNAAGRNLGRAVQEYMEQKHSDAGGLDRQRVRVWLQAVRVVWREKLVQELPQAVHQEIRKLWRELQETMI